MLIYQRVTYSDWKWPFIVHLPFKNGDFPVRYVNLPEGKYSYIYLSNQP